MNNPHLISQTANYVRTTLQGAEAGHDWWHINRVWNNAKLIGKTERVDMLVVELAALLHDIADSKFHNGDEEIGPRTAGDFLKTLSVDDEVITHIQNIIRHMSFKAGFDAKSFQSAEMDVVQDADRLDAIGAIGIARAFTYGGFKNRELYNPDIPPNLNMSKEEYKNTTAPTINHFYEKLLLLKDKMNTATGKHIAQQRHDFMLQYLDQFYGEWNGER
ncbi:HD domain-containing protein [Mucilaginibacter sp. HMF5004]|uniref:HD domain-containing protein n=1 Tax=Mucilaginibacter rivuli TaxID=2857527 RepID=UPI001C6048F3|nr:HD domain-containing protein [Mucilaginibacter rivuli]MBW4890330.1 HD domain-containing protein [Mucilaginibacter rivuli]